VACAVIRERDIGIDVENAMRRGRHLKVAERFFGDAELRVIRALAPDRQQRRFLEFWTLKEAYLKARGSGISLPLRGLQFEIGEGPSPRIRIGFDPALVRDDPAGWQFSLHHPTEIHTLAVAIRRREGRDRVIRLFEGAPGVQAAGSEIVVR
jgi:4'-phosphopantetheinyl transferase